MSEVQSQLASLLYTTFSSVSQSARQSAETQLQSFAADLPSYAQRLLELINSPASLSLRNSACMQLRSAIKQAVNSGRITAAERGSILHCLVTGMRHCEPLLNKNLATCLTGVLSNSSGDVHTETCKQLLDTVKLNLAGQPADVRAALRSLSVLFATSRHNSVAVLCSFYKESSPQLASLARFLTQQLSAPQLPQSVNDLLSLLEEWTSAIVAMFDNFELNLPKSFREVTEDFQIAEAVEGVLLLKVGGDAGEVLAGADSPTGAVVNGIKTKLLRMIALTFQYLTSKRPGLLDPSPDLSFLAVPGVPLPPSPFFSCLSRVLEPYISAVSSLCTASLTQVSKHGHLSSAVYESIQLVLMCSAELPFAAVLSRTYRTLVVFVGLPLLHSPVADIAVMEDNQEEFVNSTVDMCDKRKSETVKAAAAQLINGLCDKVDGALTFTVVVLLQLLDWSIAETQDISNFPVLSASGRGSALFQLSQEQRIEVSLLGLCVLAESVRRRSDLIVGLSLAVSNCLPTLMTTSSPLLRSRLCLLLSFYFTDVFPTDGGKAAYLSFLTGSLDPTSVPRVVYLQACAALAALVKQESVQHELSSVAGALLLDLATVLPLQREKAFFESVQEVVAAYPQSAAGCVVQLLEGVVTVVVEDVTRRCKRGPKGRDCTAAAKCWAIVRTMAEGSCTTPEVAVQMETGLEPLIGYLSHAEEVDFEDDLIVVWTTIVKQMKEVSPTAWSLYGHLPSIQAKYTGDFGHLFPLLNAILFYGAATLCSQAAALSQFISMSLTCLFALDATQVRESSQSEGLLLIQELMLVAPPGLIDSYLQQIYTAALLRYSQGCKHALLKVRILATFLAGIRYNPTVTFSLLAGAGQQSLFFSELTVNLVHFSHSYDKKLCSVAVLALLLTADTQLPLGELFNFIVGVLALRSKPAPKSSESCPSDDEETNQHRVGVAEVTSEEAEINILLSSMLSHLKEFDEVDYFRTFVWDTSRQNPGLMEFLGTTLRGDRVQDLKDVLSSRRVPTSHCAESTCVRVIRKAKRKLGK